MKPKILINAMMCICMCLVICSCAQGGQVHGSSVKNTLGTAESAGNNLGTAASTGNTLGTAPMGNTSGTAAGSGKVNAPDIAQIRTICEMATLECYYHNVAKSVKEKGSGLLHIGEVERTFWIEYSGVAKLGIDMSKVTMETDGDRITITIPKAKLLGMSDYSFTEDSYISSDDGLNKNPITAENQTEAVAAANEHIRQLFESDDTMLMRAQERARKLIENYINQLSELSGTDYQIEWVYEKNS